jgi:hypothetical protein
MSESSSLDKKLEEAMHNDNTSDSDSDSESGEIQTAIGTKIDSDSDSDSDKHSHKNTKKKTTVKSNKEKNKKNKESDSEDEKSESNKKSKKKAKVKEDSKKTSKRNKDDEFKTAKPLTEEEVDAARKRLASLDAKDLNNILDTYTQVLKGLITMVLKATKDEEDIAEVDHLKRLIGMVPKDELFLRSKDKIWDARERILNKDAAWFINRDYSKLIKKDSKQTMIETLVNIAKRYYTKLDDDEQDLYWQKAIKLLQIVAQFKKLVREG